MFERFTQEARAIVAEAYRDAGERGAPEITPLHLLVALLRFPDSGAARVLDGFGVAPGDVATEAGRVRRRAGITDADAVALEEFGVDIDRIVERIEQAHGPGALAGESSRAGKREHVPFADESKKTLQICLKEVVRLGGRRLGSEHILLALAAQRGPAADVLARFDIDADRVRRALAPSGAE